MKIRCGCSLMVILFILNVSPNDIVYIRCGTKSWSLTQYNYYISLQLGDGYFLQMGYFWLPLAIIFFGNRGDPFYLWKRVWLFFVWTSCKERLRTLDLFQKRGTVLPNMWSLCLQDAESINHLFIHCPFSREIWVEVIHKVGISWIFPNHLRDLVQG